MTHSQITIFFCMSEASTIPILMINALKKDSQPGFDRSLERGVTGGGRARDGNEPIGIGALLVEIDGFPW